FFYEYPLQRRCIDPERSKLAFKGPGGEVELVFGRDYFFPSTNDIVALEREGGAVYCGKGEREDFEKVQVKDRWALCLASDLSARRRARSAQTAGALGVIVVPDPAGADDSAAQTYARTTDHALNGLTEFRADEDPVFPQACLSLAAARRAAPALGLGAGLPE